MNLVRAPSRFSPVEGRAVNVVNVSFAQRAATKISTLLVVFLCTRMLARFGIILPRNQCPVLCSIPLLRLRSLPIKSPDKRQRHRYDAHAAQPMPPNPLHFVSIPIQ